jgi:hypothetical protein
MRRLILAVALILAVGVSARAQCPNGRCPRPQFVQPQAVVVAPAPRVYVVPQPQYRAPVYGPPRRIRWYYAAPACPGGRCYRR